MPNRTTTLTNAVTLESKRGPLFSYFGVFALIIGMVIAFFMSQLIGVYVAGKLLLPMASNLSVGDIFFLGSSDGTVVSVSIIISCVLLTAFSVWIVRSKGSDVRQYLALTPFAFAVGMGMLGLLLLFMIGSQTLTYLLDKTPFAFVDPLYHSVSSVWLLIIAMVIVAPIYEELLFRGILWSAIAEQFSEQRGVIIASVVTSLIFAVIHLQYGVYEISTIVLLALLFCYARIKSGSLLLPMLLHIINNAAAMWLYLSQAA